MTTKEFFEKQKDTDLIKKLTAVKTLEETYAVAKEYGVTDSMQAFKKEMEARKAATGELSDDDLEAVAGGVTYKRVYDEWANV